MSLRIKTLLPLAFFSLVLLAYLYAYWMPSSLANMEAGHRKSLELHMDSVAEGLIPLLLGHQLDTIYENLSILQKRNIDWISIQLLDDEGKTIYPLSTSPTTGRHGKDVHILRHPIKCLDMDLGLLVVTVDFGPRLSEMKKKHWELITVTLLIVVAFIATVGFILERVVIRPVNLLARASQLLAEGDFDVLLVKAGDDEIGILVDSFVDMRKAIREYRSTLQSAHEQLQSELAERKQAEEALKETATCLTEAQRIAHIGSWELDVAKNVLTWSGEVYRMFEIDPERFGATYGAFLDAIHPDDRETVDVAYTNSLKTKTPYSIEHRLLFPEGRIKYVHERCETLYDEEGNAIRSVGTVQDITERKRAEQEIQKLNAELEQRVKERTAELEAKNRELDKMNRLFIGRELRMVELKERIRELEEKQGGQLS